MIQSGVKLPNPGPVTGSLLLTPVIEQAGLGSQLSVAVATTVTGTMRWFGGQSTLGVAVTLPITGGSTSFTVTVKLQVAVAPFPSVAVQLTFVAPTGKTEPAGGAQTAVTPGQLSVTVGDP